MRSRVKREADVLREGADICALATAHAQLGERCRIAQQLELMDLDAARGTLDGTALTRKLVERHAVALQGGMHGRHLLDRAAEAREHRFYIGRGCVHRPLLEQGAL